MNNQQVSKKPTTAYIFSLLGGVFSLLIILFLVIGNIGYISRIGFLFFGLLIVAPILTIAFARKLDAEPIEHFKWGLLILFFGILDTLLLFTTHGNIVDAVGLFSMVGGILSLTYKPVRITKTNETQAPPTYSPQQQPLTQPNQQVITKEKETIIKEVVMVPCKYCGALTPQLATFCPNCGAKK